MSSPSASAAVEHRPLSVGELSRLVEGRYRDGGPRLRIVGGRTAIAPWPEVRGEVETIVTTGLARVVDYPARDLTITVEAGIRVEELQSTLAQQGQTLPIDIPEARRATIGGAIAANAAGPGRYGYGTFRDYLLGVRAVDGQGRLFAAGGRVVKNVAGYDLCKLLVGSGGELAAIAEVTLKVRPRPESRRLVWCEMAGWPAVERGLERLVTTATRPMAVEVLNAPAVRALTRESKLALPEVGPVLCVGFDGSDRETGWQVETLIGELGSATSAVEVVGPDDAAELWSALTEYQTTSDEPVTFRATLRPSGLVEFVARASVHDAAVQGHAGNGVLVGHLPDGISDAATARAMLSELGELARAGSGELQVGRCEAGWRAELSEFCGQSRTPLETKLREAFDPRGVFAW